MNRINQCLIVLLTYPDIFKGKHQWSNELRKLRALQLVSDTNEITAKGRDHLSKLQTEVF